MGNSHTQLHENWVESDSSIQPKDSAIIGDVPPSARWDFGRRTSDESLMIVCRTPNRSVSPNTSTHEPEQVSLPVGQPSDGPRDAESHLVTDIASMSANVRLRVPACDPGTNSSKRSRMDVESLKVTLSYVSSTGGSSFQNNCSGLGLHSSGPDI